MNWFKWLGIVCMGLASACLGFWMASRMDKRLEEYRQLQKVLMLLMSRMRLDESMAAAMESCVLAGAGAFEPWLTRMAERLMQRQPLSEVWTQELDRAKSELHLEAEDYRVLKSLGQSLQGARLESCLGQISQVQDYFHRQQSMLEAAIAEQGRMYRSIGILAGILIMVVLA